MGININVSEKTDIYIDILIQRERERKINTHSQTHRKHTDN